MYENLIERLREYPDREENVNGYVEIDWQDLLDAADAIHTLTAENAAYRAFGLTPDDLPRAAELLKADREGLCVVLPSMDYTFTVRGGIAISIIKANCDAATHSEAEAALAKENRPN